MEYYIGEHAAYAKLAVIESRQSTPAVVYYM